MEVNQSLAKKDKQVVVGKVVSSKAQKTIVVLVERQVKHPLYQKYMRRSTKYHAHDEGGVCKEGDLVSIEQCRPVSKTKSWRLVEVLKSTSEA